MLTALQRAAIDFDYPGPNSHVSPDGTVTFQLRGQPRETEHDFTYLVQLGLIAEATVAKIAGVDCAQHLDALRARKVAQEVVDDIARHWDSFDLDCERQVLALAREYAQSSMPSTENIGAP